MMSSSPVLPETENKMGMKENIHFQYRIFFCFPLLLVCVFKMISIQWWSSPLTFYIQKRNPGTQSWQYTSLSKVIEIRIQDLIKMKTRMAKARKMTTRVLKKATQILFPAHSGAGDKSQLGPFPCRQHSIEET